MCRSEKTRKTVITMALSLGLIAGLAGLAATYSRSADSSWRGLLSILGGAVFFALGFSAVFFAARAVRWVIEGFNIDEEGYEIEENQPKNLREGFKRIALVVALVAGLVVASAATTYPIAQRRKARNDLRIVQAQGTQYRGKAYYDYAQRLRVQDNFWLNLDAVRFCLLCVMVFLAVAVGVFVAVVLVYRFIEQLVLNALRSDQ